ncbi:MAG: hypothetical protein LC721_07610 [Actinobacteria bacterium]|nr:hypothetical protein [Actinomycetota bacterium]
MLWRTMQTDYSGPTDSSAMSVPAPNSCVPATNGSQSIGGGRLYKTVLAELFAVLSPHRDRARSPRQAATSGSGWQCWNWPWERALFEPDRALRWYGSLNEKTAALRR